MIPKQFHGYQQDMSVQLAIDSYSSVEIEPIWPCLDCIVSNCRSIQPFAAASTVDIQALWLLESQDERPAEAEFRHGCLHAVLTGSGRDQASLSRALWYLAHPPHNKQPLPGMTLCAALLLSKSACPWHVAHFCQASACITALQYASDVIQCS